MATFSIHGGIMEGLGMPMFVLRYSKCSLDAKALIVK
jgi:hypothetical protein